MYDKVEVKSKVLDVLRKASKIEVEFTKQQNFERAIYFAKDEILEFEMLFNKFISDVSHLEVFQSSIKEPLTKDVRKRIEKLTYLVEKNYTKEDKESMPENVLKQVRATQEVRFQLLKKIAQRYLKRD